MFDRTVRLAHHYRAQSGDGEIMPALSELSPRSKLGRDGHRHLQADAMVDARSGSRRGRASLCADVPMTIMAPLLGATIKAVTVEAETV